MFVLIEFFKSLNKLMLYKYLVNLSNTLYSPLLLTQSMIIIRWRSSIKSSQSTDSDARNVSLSRSWLEYWWYLILASVPWWRPAKRGSTDHSVVIEAMRRSQKWKEPTTWLHLFMSYLQRHPKIRDGEDFVLVLVLVFLSYSPHTCELFENISFI